ncbi:hypothetical protein WL51_19340 [Burkholderia ubonensis]|uniref:hypothetical protein n=1 Tax=Burkholderia ubonensis TaxID=101571 RepID=UPI00075DC10A|nr:hypothetical protein [Burkholderia ubonensis]KWC36271.1 hypothetical protein WL51_19340 [Burkholderia ubonensis]
MLEKLKEYKELIAIVAFFLGGFLWIQEQYPTKTDLKSQIGVLNCLLGEYMLLTQQQLRVRDLERLIHDETSQIGSYENARGAKAAALSPAMLEELDAKKDDLATHRAELKTRTAEMQKVNDELQRNVCQKVMP